ncbi:hypothetical protein CCHR01_01692 [Colletotrichum chrysophilum]|uniref:Uncharacterized protein n=1 Tax=Colletotrichum chrysophilum TaxID=1836956 RepID=A0AAD9EPC0_9PEZI|nr:hypothetical protein CCHR01_01692 [Colletotrichum chrysophilum]
MWLHMNPLFDNGVYSGLHHSYDQEFPFEQPRCPTTECRWNDFSSLGLCVKTANITDSFNVTYKEGRASGQGPLANLTQAHLKITQMPFDKPRNRSVYLVNKSNLTYFLGNQTANKIGAMEILFYYCVQRFKVSIENNIASRPIVSTSADRKDDFYEYMNGTRIKFDALKIPEEPGTFFPLTPVMTLVLNVSLTAAFNNTYYETWEREYGHIRGLASTRYFNVLNLVRNEDAAGVTATFFDPSTNVTGEAYVTETYVFVRWGWLAFISAQVLLSILLVGVAIIQTRQAGLGVAKSSILPSFFAINSQDKHALEQEGTRSIQQKEMESMIQNKSGAGWRLGLTERGWILKR